MGSKKCKLGSLKGDSVKIDISDFRNYIAFPHAWGFGSPNLLPGAYEFNLNTGCQYALFSNQLSNDVSAVNGAGDIQIRLVVNTKESFIEFTRLKDVDVYTKTDTKFQLKNVKSQLNVWSGSMSRNGTFQFQKLNDEKFYSFGNITYDFSKFTILDKTTLEVKDSTIKEGDNWKASDNFVSATNESGLSVQLSSIAVSGSVNTQVPGKYTVTYKNNSISKKATVTVAEKKLTAEVIQAEFSLGTTEENINLMDYVTNVKLDGNLLSQNQFKVESIDKISTDTIMSTKIKARVSTTVGTIKSIDIEIPVSVVWGKSLAVSGSWSTSADVRIIGAFALNDNTLTYAQGQQSSSTTTAMLPQVGTNVFAEFRVYPNNVNQNVNHGSEEFSFTLSGNESISQAKSNWNEQLPSSELKITNGTVVSLWHKFKTGEGPYNRAWNFTAQNNELVDLSDNQNEIYYEVTDSGFRLLGINKLVRHDNLVPIGMTNRELDRNIQEYLDNSGNSNISVSQFLEYPDTSKEGTSIGKILVEERLESGSKIRYIYEISFIVKG